MTLHRDAPAPTRRRRRASTAPEQALVARLEELSGSTAVSLDDDVRAATRGRLVAMAAVRTPPARPGLLRRLLGGDPDLRSGRRRTRLTAGLAGAALTVVALGGLLTAAEGARPGDLLYGLKRGSEQTQLALAGDASRGTTLLDFASTRLTELEELVGAGSTAAPRGGPARSGGEAGLAAGPDVDLVLDTLQTMDRQTAEGAAELASLAVRDDDPDVLDALTGWAAGQRTGIAGLTGSVPAGAQAAVTAAAELVDRVAARGDDLRTAVGCPGAPATAGTDDLGPLPGRCPAEPPPAASGPAPGTAPAPAPALPGTVGSEATALTSVAPDAGTAAAPEVPAPAPTTAAVPPAATPAGPPSAGRPTTAVPGPTARPGLPLPTLPTPPGPPFPVPGRPGGPGTGPAPGPVVSLPPLVPGVRICLPPVVTVGC